MKYCESVERSAELLRQVLPLMSRQSSALHPYSYALWYEYVLQTNPALRAAVDAEIKAHGSLDEASTRTLYQQFVAVDAGSAADRMAAGVERLLTNIEASASRAGDQTSRFGAALGRLRDDVAPPSQEVLEEVLQHTEGMQAEVQRLQQQLDNSRREITDLRQEVRAIRQDSLADGLTGLANRRAFDQRLAASVVAGQAVGGAPLGTLIVIDIDLFKRINDNYGHAFGDQVLKAVAQVLKAVTPPDGLVARIGGEEFALLLPGMPAIDAQALAERVRTSVAGSRIRRATGEVLERVTVSLGLSALRAGDTADTWYGRADAALYEAKRAGRDRVALA